MQNIGEAILIIGILYIFYLTDNYYILFLLALPILTWTMIHHDEEIKRLNIEEQQLKNRKLEAEIEKLNAEINEIRKI